VDDDNPYALWERNFRQQMQRLREAQELTQTDLARSLKAFGLPFHQQTIQRIESGERPVRLNEAHLIAKTLGVTVDSMTAAGTPSQRELRYAVDRLRHGAAVGGEELLATMNDWLEDIETLAVAVSDRNPRLDLPRDQLDDATRWGMKWAILADGAFAKLIDAWAALGGIEGQDEEMLTFEHPVMGVIDAWSQAAYDDLFPRSLGVGAPNTNELYASLPKDDDGEHQKKA
jgi:transcriptional regulator with XRE-family HTH domain